MKGARGHAGAAGRGVHRGRGTGRLPVQAGSGMIQPAALRPGGPARVNGAHLANGPYGGWVASGLGGRGGHARCGRGRRWGTLAASSREGFPTGAESRRAGGAAGRHEQRMTEIPDLLVAAVANAQNGRARHSRTRASRRPMVPAGGSGGTCTRAHATPSGDPVRCWAAAGAARARSSSSLAVDMDLIAGRLPQRVEVAACHVVSEMLTNATKHARASVVEVAAKAFGGMLRVCVRHDRVGGAEPLRAQGWSS
jgi:hypothetical protein